MDFLYCQALQRFMNTLNSQGWRLTLGMHCAPLFLRLDATQRQRVHQFN